MHVSDKMEKIYNFKCYLFNYIYVFDKLKTLYTCTNQAQQRRNTGNI